MKSTGLIIFALLSVCTESYKILGVVPAVAYSHFTLGFRLMKELADRGHEVTFINSFPQKEPIKNLRDVPVPEIKKPIDKFISNLVDFGQLSYGRQLEWVVQYGKVKSRAVLQHENVQNLMKSNETYDVVILDHFFNDAFAIFAHRFNCPLILLSPWASNMFNNLIFGNPAPSSFVTNLLVDYDANMNFWQRLDNIYREIIGEFYMNFRMIPGQNEVLKETFPDSPDLATIIFNTSFMLAASDVSLGDPLPLLPTIKEIGGYHVSPPKPLPKDLQEFMDNSTEGVVVFSMGSNLKSANFELQKRKAILNAFSRIKQKVLWKFETDLPEKSENVKVSKWLPQSDVLAHPNTVAFISHGGLLGTTEAVYHGVPILGLPIFWDQIKNIGMAEKKGFGLKVDFHRLDEESFTAALNELLNNPKYRKIAKQRSTIMHDQPLKPLDNAIFWIEYVIRHKGAPHLRSAALNLRWYQLHSLDIILFIFCSIIGFFVTFKLVLRCFCIRKKSVIVDKKYE